MAGSDFVVCGICGLRGYSLKSHIKREHGLTKERYELDHGPAVCRATRERYRDSGNYDWINRAKDTGQDLGEWRQKLSACISAGVMASETARKARRQNLTRLNRTEEFRRRSSDTAARTSARPEVIICRTATIRRWREENRELFHQKCVIKMINRFQSVPERFLFGLITELFPGRFKRGQQVRRVGKFTTVKSGTRQVDILDLDNKVVVEFDGPRHFRSFGKNDCLDVRMQADRELNAVLVEDGFLVIRISCDQFTYRCGGSFQRECVRTMQEAISAGKRGLIQIGVAYK